MEPRRRLSHRLLAAAGLCLAYAAVACTPRVALPPGLATAPRLIMTFADYRVVSGVPLPFAIELRAPARNVTMQIVLRAYEITPTLADTLFDGADAAGST